MSRNTKNPVSRKRTGTKAAQAAEQSKPLKQRLITWSVCAAIAYLVLWGLMDFLPTAQAQSDVPVIEEVVEEEDADSFLNRWLTKKAGEYDNQLKAKAAELDQRERDLDSREDELAVSEQTAGLTKKRVEAVATTLLACSTEAIKEMQNVANDPES